MGLVQQIEMFPAHNASLRQIHGLSFVLIKAPMINHSVALIRDNSASCVELFREAADVVC